MPNGRKKNSPCVNRSSKKRKKKNHFQIVHTNNEGVLMLIILFIKQVPSPMPGFNLLVRLSDESNAKATNVIINANPQEYIMYKPKRFRSENDLKAFVVLKKI